MKILLWLLGILLISIYFHSCLLSFLVRVTPKYVTINFAAEVKKKNFCQTLIFLLCLLFFCTIRHIFPLTSLSQNFSVSQYTRRGLLLACWFIFHPHRVIDTVQSNATGRCNDQTHCCTCRKLGARERRCPPRTPLGPRYAFLTASPPPSRTPHHWIQHHSECHLLISRHLQGYALQWQLSLSVTRNRAKGKKNQQQKKKKQAMCLRTAPECSMSLPKIVNWSSRVSEMCELLIK